MSDWSSRKVKALGKKDLLILVDIADSYLNIEILDELKKAGRIIKEITMKEAIIGITGHKRILLQIIQTFTNLHFNVFNTTEEAKNWLIEEENNLPSENHNYGNRKPDKS